MDEISTAFANVKPEDFHRETSALTDQAAPSTTGEEPFHTFIDMLILISKNRVFTKSVFEPFAVMANTERQRLFAADQDETPEDWATRLQREARAMQATWLYVSLLTPARHYIDQPLDTLDTPEAISAALDKGDVAISLCWAAFRREGEEFEQLAGMIPLTKDVQPGPSTEGAPADNNPFIKVLLGGWE